MSCENCKSTVWFDHDQKRWRHARKPLTRCKKPFPRPAGGPVHR